LKIVFPQIQIGNFQLEESLSLIENCFSSNTNWQFSIRGESFADLKLLFLKYKLAIFN